MSKKPDLRKLVGITGPERAFLTVYLPQGRPGKAIDQRTSAIWSLLSEYPEELFSVDLVNN